MTSLTCRSDSPSQCGCHWTHGGSSTDAPTNPSTVDPVQMLHPVREPLSDPDGSPSTDGPSYRSVGRSRRLFTDRVDPVKWKNVNMHTHAQPSTKAATSVGTMCTDRQWWSCSRSRDPLWFVHKTRHAERTKKNRQRKSAKLWWEAANPCICG
jgi:hypothetical protein